MPVNAVWKEDILFTPEGRSLAVVRLDDDGSWVWHARHLYGLDGEVWAGKPDMTRAEAQAAAIEALREEYEFYKGVFEP